MYKTLAETFKKPLTDVHLQNVVHNHDGSLRFEFIPSDMKAIETKAKAAIAMACLGFKAAGPTGAIVGGIAGGLFPYTIETYVKASCKPCTETAELKPASSTTLAGGTVTEPIGGSTVAALAAAQNQLQFNKPSPLIFKTETKIDCPSTNDCSEVFKIKLSSVAAGGIAGFNAAGIPGAVIGAGAGFMESSLSAIEGAIIGGIPGAIIGTIAGIDEFAMAGASIGGVAAGLPGAAIGAVAGFAAHFLVDTVFYLVEPTH